MVLLVVEFAPGRPGPGRVLPRTAVKRFVLRALKVIYLQQKKTRKKLRYTEIASTFGASSRFACFLSVSSVKTKTKNENTRVRLDGRDDVRTVSSVGGYLLNPCGRLCLRPRSDNNNNFLFKRVTRMASIYRVF